MTHDANQQYLAPVTESKLLMVINLSIVQVLNSHVNITHPLLNITYTSRKIVKQSYINRYVIVYYSIGFKKSTSKFWRQINKSGREKFYFNFVKPTPYNIFSYILFDIFNRWNQTYSRKEIQNLFYFTRLFRGG